MKTTGLVGAMKVAVILAQITMLDTTEGSRFFVLAVNFFRRGSLKVRNDDRYI